MGISRRIKYGSNQFSATCRTPEDTLHIPCRTFLNTISTVNTSSAHHKLLEDHTLLRTTFPLGTRVAQLVFLGVFLFFATAKFKSEPVKPDVFYFNDITPPCSSFLRLLILSRAFIIFSFFLNDCGSSYKGEKLSSCSLLGSFSLYFYHINTSNNLPALVGQLVAHLPAA